VAAVAAVSSSLAASEADLAPGSAPCAPVAPGPAAAAWPAARSATMRLAIEAVSVKFPATCGEPPASGRGHHELPGEIFSEANVTEKKNCN